MCQVSSFTLYYRLLSSGLQSTITSPIISSRQESYLHHQRSVFLMGSWTFLLRTIIASVSKPSFKKKIGSFSHLQSFIYPFNERLLRAHQAPRYLRHGPVLKETSRERPGRQTLVAMLPGTLIWFEQSALRASGKASRGGDIRAADGEVFPVSAHSFIKPTCLEKRYGYILGTILISGDLKTSKVAPAYKRLPEP